RISFALVLSQVEVGINVYDSQRVAPGHHKRIDAEERTISNFMSTANNQRSVPCGKKLMHLTTEHSLSRLHFLSGADNIAGIVQQYVVPMKCQVAKRLTNSGRSLTRSGSPEVSSHALIAAKAQEGIAGCAGPRGVYVVGQVEGLHDGVPSLGVSASWLVDATSPA